MPGREDVTDKHAFLRVAPSERSGESEAESDHPEEDPQVYPLPEARKEGSPKEEEQEEGEEEGSEHASSPGASQASSRGSSRSAASKSQASRSQKSGAGSADSASVASSRKSRSSARSSAASSSRKDNATSASQSLGVGQTITEDLEGEESEEGESGESEEEDLESGPGSSEQDPLLKESGRPMTYAAKAAAKAKAKAEARAAKAASMAESQGPKTPKRTLATPKKPPPKGQLELCIENTPWIPICSTLLVLGVVFGISYTIYIRWCVVSEWGDWDRCHTEVVGAPHCGPGVQTKKREVLKGICDIPLERTRSCDMGVCMMPDLLAQHEPLPCNDRSRAHILQEAAKVYGGATWKALTHCLDAYLCCAACDIESDLSAKLDCHGRTIVPRPLFTADGCLSCFALATVDDMGNGSQSVVCEGNPDYCMRSASSLASGREETMCCFAVGPQPAALQRAADKAEKQEALPPVKENSDEFERHKDTSAFIGVLHTPYSWPATTTEAGCQQACWTDESCAIYSYVSHHSSNRAWRGRCVTWDMETATAKGRASAADWIPAEGVYSGLKAPVKYSTVLIQSRTAEEPGSGSVGPLHLIICKNSESCQDRSPVILEPTSCLSQDKCLSEGITSHFTGVVAVHKDFQLHGVRIVSMTDDTWVAERVVVHFEGQEGSHHGHVGITRDKPLFFSVGCVTTSEDYTATAKPGMPCKTKCKAGAGTYGWCYVDEKKEAWGACSKACRTEGVGKKGHGAAISRSGMSCAELNWPTISAYNHDRHVCSASNSRPLRGCSGHVSYTAAKDFCEAAGARLCTQEELERDEAAGSGCNTDNSYIWSSTSCNGDTGYMTLAGSKAVRSSLKSGCSLPEDTAQAACCADARVIEITFNRRHRDQHVLPPRMTVKQEGGLANWEVVAGTNRFGKRSFFLQSGMLDDQAPIDSEYLDIYITDVPIARRGGEIQFYFRIDSERDADKLHFYIDGNEQTTSGFPVSGQVDWRMAVFAFPFEEKQEVHNFSWRYRKDRSVTIGRDVANLDDISIFGVVGLE